MNPAKLVAALVGMCALGALAFWGMAALWSVRVAQPIASVPRPIDAGAPVQALQDGLQRDLQIARRAAGEGNRPELVRALDGARRVARVGHFAAGPRFARTLHAIEDARRAVQDGREGDVGRSVDEAMAALVAESPTGRINLAAEPPRAAGRYRGAVVLDPMGDRIGRLKEVTGARAVIVLGGKQGLFGFLNVGGAETTVSRDALVFGPAPRLGPTIVILAASGAPQKANGSSHVPGQGVGL